MAYNQQLSVFSQVAPATTGTAGQVLVSAGSGASSYWAATIPVSAYSAQFSGSTQYLNVPTNTAFDLGTTYTVECWIYPTSLLGGIVHRGYYTASGQTWAGLTFSIRGLGNTLRVYYYATSFATEQYIDMSPAPTLNAWNHIAMVRNGTTGTVYLNGAAAGTITGLNTSATSTRDVRIGLWDFSANSEYFPGYISNLRITKGVAVYTGAFTTPTSPLGTSQAAGTNISAITPSQVVLLTCNGTGFTDTSPNAFTITNNNNAVTSQFAPFSSFSAIARSATQTQTILTSGSGTYYTPSGVAWLRVRMIGGGGGGSGSNAGNWGGSGGGSGAYLEAAIVSPASSYAYSIGSGGGGGAAVSSGSAGANTTFGSLNCGGGLAGLYGSFNTGTAPTASGGYLNVAGIAGGGGTYGTVQAIGGVSGAPSPFSAGGAGSNPSGATLPGLAGAYGSGGGGAGQTPSGSSGGSGGSGLIIVEENYAVSTTYSGLYTASYLVVAGGGSSGDNIGGGGGAGGLLAGTGILSVGTSYTVIVGAGGAQTGTNTSGANGSYSSITGIATAVGGGGGGYNPPSGYSGGSGGGSSGFNSTGVGGSGTAGQGNNGGATGGSLNTNSGGGGGGAGAAGATGTSVGTGNGGIGLTTTLITTAQATSASVGQVVSTSVYFSGGGGGGSYSGAAAGAGGSGGGGAGTGTNNTRGTAGTVNTGGGGGGSGGGGSSPGSAAGGSGCVIISVPTQNYSGITTGSPTVVTNGNQTVLIFKSSGSYTA